MNTPELSGFDHVHVYVPARREAARWYTDHFGFEVAPEFEFWAEHDGGPLTLRDRSDRIHIALFRRQTPKPVSLAFRASAEQYGQWRDHLTAAGLAPREADHTRCFSMYVSDPWANDWEITCYEVDALRPQA